QLSDARRPSSLGKLGRRLTPSYRRVESAVAVARLTARLPSPETAAGCPSAYSSPPGRCCGLVQAMAAVGGASGADGLNAASFDIDASQQQFLTAPPYA